MLHEPIFGTFEWEKQGLIEYVASPISLYGLNFPCKNFFAYFGYLEHKPIIIIFCPTKSKSQNKHFESTISWVYN